MPTIGAPTDQGGSRQTTIGTMHTGITSAQSHALRLIRCAATWPIATQ